MAKTFLKNLLIAFLISGGLLFLLAFLVYRLELKENVVSIAIILVYVLSNLTAGILLGKKQQSRKFLWGLLEGTAYFVILVVVSLIVNKSTADVAGNFFFTLLICAGSGMLGGMLG